MGAKRQKVANEITDIGLRFSYKWFYSHFPVPRACFPFPYAVLVWDSLPGWFSCIRYQFERFFKTSSLRIKFAHIKKCSRFPGVVFFTFYYQDIAILAIIKVS